MKCTEVSTAKQCVKARIAKTEPRCHREHLCVRPTLPLFYQYSSSNFDRLNTLELNIESNRRFKSEVKPHWRADSKRFCSTQRLRPTHIFPRKLHAPPFCPRVVCMRSVGVMTKVRYGIQNIHDFSTIGKLSTMEPFAHIPSVLAKCGSISVLRPVGFLEALPAGILDVVRGFRWLFLLHILFLAESMFRFWREQTASIAACSAN